MDTISAVICAYNEEENIVPLTKSLLEVFNKLNKEFEIIYVIEGTGRAADEFAAHPTDAKLMQIFNVHDLDRFHNELNYALKITE